MYKTNFVDVSCLPMQLMSSAYACACALPLTTTQTYWSNVGCWAVDALGMQPECDLTVARRHHGPRVVALYGRSFCQQVLEPMVGRRHHRRKLRDIFWGMLRE